MNASGQEAALARLQARRRQIRQELNQVERRIARARLQVVTVEERIARRSQRQRPAA